MTGELKPATITTATTIAEVNTAKGKGMREAPTHAFSSARRCPGRKRKRPRPPPSNEDGVADELVLAEKVRWHHHPRSDIQQRAGVGRSAGLISTSTRSRMHRRFPLGVACCLLLLLHPAVVAAIETAGAGSLSSNFRNSAAAAAAASHSNNNNHNKIRRRRRNQDYERDVTPAPRDPPVPPPPTPMPATAAPVVQPTTAAPVTDAPTTASPVATDAPTRKPTERPTLDPTYAYITERPTNPPTRSPTMQPSTEQPTQKPTEQPTTDTPTETPTEQPTTEQPTGQPTQKPTSTPRTEAPTAPPPSPQPTSVQADIVAPPATQELSSPEPTRNVASSAPTVSTSIPTPVPVSVSVPVPSSPLPSDAPSLMPAKAPVVLPPTEEEEAPAGESIGETEAPADGVVQTTEAPTTPPPPVMNGRDVTPMPAPATTTTTAAPTKSPTNVDADSNIFDRDDGSDETDNGGGSTDDAQVSKLTVPIEFTADLRHGSSQNVTSMLETVERNWELAIFNYLRGKYREQPGVQVLGVDLSLEEADAARLLLLVRRQRRRALQQQQTTTIDATGGADFEIDEALVDLEAFALDAQQDLDRQLTETDLLQEALTRGEQVGDDENGEAVQVSGVVSGMSDGGMAGGATKEVEDKSGNGKPSTASVVIGFTLLVFTLLSLAFWGRVLYKKRKKRRRQRRLEELRKSQSVAMIPPDSSFTSGSRIGYPSPKSSDNRMEVAHTLSLESMSTYNGIPSNSDDDEKVSLQSDEDDEERTSKSGDDSFALELQRAASLDRRAWDEYLQKKQTAQQRKVEDTASTTPVINGVLSSGSSAAGLAASANVAVYDAPGSQDMGMEVEPRGPPGSFPYGDENSRGAPGTPVALTSDDAVQWTIEGISLASAYKKDAAKEKPDAVDNDFEPYGDRRTLQQSWDLDENPVKDESGPSRFSFLYPFKRKSVAEVPPDGRCSPSADDSPTDASVRDSPDVTSLDSPIVVQPSELDESKEDSLTELTNSMLKEVDEIANYLKQYEKRKVEMKSKQRMAQRTHAGLGDLDDELDILETSWRREEQGRLGEGESLPLRSGERDPYQNPQEHSRSPESRSLPNASQNSSRLEPRRVVEGQSRSMESSAIQYNALNDSESARRRIAEKGGAPIRSPQKETPLRVTAIPATLSDSSESETEVDDSSLRLGISRISIEKPKAPNLSFRNDTSQNSSPFETPYRLSPIRPLDDSTMSVASQSESILSALRHSPSMLDTVPSDEKPRAKEKEDTGKRRFSRNNKGDSVQPPVEQISTKRKKGISPRSKNKTFNSIFSMFEEKPAAPIVPPNEMWQYSGSNAAAGSKYPSDPQGRRSSPRFA